MRPREILAMPVEVARRLHAAGELGEKELLAVCAGSVGVAMESGESLEGLGQDEPQEADS